MSNENKVVLPEPVEQVKEVMVLVGKYGSAVEANSTGNPSNYTLASDESAAYAAIETKLRALLATATGLPAQSVKLLAADAKEFYELASVMIYGEFSPYYKAVQRAAQNKGNK